MKSRAVVAGSLTIDDIHHGSESTRRLGGAVTYAGLTFARLGVDTTVVTRVAATERPLLTVLQNEGVRVSGRESLHTTRFVNLVFEEDRAQEVPSRADPIQVADIDFAMLRDAHVHVGALHPDDLDLELVRYLHSHARSVSVDVQGFVRRISGGRVVDEAHESLPTVLTASAVVKADVHELDLMLDFLGLSEADLLDSFSIDEILVTEGSRGGKVLRRGGSPFVYEAHSVVEAGHAVGAGDVFSAAYTTHRLLRRQTVSKACAAAAILAASQVAGTFITDETLLAGTVTDGEGPVGTLAL